MAGTSIQVQVTGDLRRFQDNLQGLVDFDFTGLNRKIAQAGVNSTLERFQQGVDPAGNTWPESASAQMARIQKERLASELESMGRAPRKRKNETRAQRLAREKALAQRADKRAQVRDATRYAGAHKTLVDTARLRNSIHAVATPDAAEWGTDVIYARAHQFGYEDNNLPARPYLGVNDDDRRVIQDIVEDHIKQKAGL